MQDKTSARLCQSSKVGVKSSARRSTVNLGPLKEKFCDGILKTGNAETKNEWTKQNDQPPIKIFPASGNNNSNNNQDRILFQRLT